MKIGKFNTSEPTMENTVVEPEVKGVQEQEKTIEFPLPETLVPDTLSGIRISCEQIHYTMDTAQNQISLLEASLDTVRAEEEDISDLSMAAIVSQLSTVSKTVSHEDEVIIEQLMKKLTTDNPYKREAVLESLVSSIGTLKNVAYKGLSPLVIVNNYLNKNIDVKNIITELNGVSKALTPAARPVEEIKEGGETLKDFDLISQAIQSNQEPESIPSFIATRTQGDSEVSMTACTLISKGFKSIKLDQSRVINVADLHSLGKYLDNVIVSQKAMDEVLQGILGTLNTEQINDTIISNAIQTVNSGISNFWSTINKLTTVSTDNGEGKVFDIMPGMTGVILLGDGQSSAPTTVSSEGVAVLKQNALVDLALYMSEIASKKFAMIVKQSADMNIKINQILEISKHVSGSQAPVSQVAMDSFAAMFNKLVVASKFMSHFTFTATNAYQSVCNSITNVSRGVAILAEST